MAYGGVVSPKSYRSNSTRKAQLLSDPKSVNWRVRNLILNCFVQEKQIENEIKIRYINKQEELSLVYYPVILKLQTRKDWKDNQ